MYKWGLAGLPRSGPTGPGCWGEGTQEVGHPALPPIGCGCGAIMGGARQGKWPREVGWPAPLPD